MKRLKRVVLEMPAGIVYEGGNTKKNKTGDWRSMKPVVDQEKCTKCRIFENFCPEACIPIHDEGAVKNEIDYDYCKGCGICANECPVKAIQMIREKYVCST